MIGQAALYLAAPDDAAVAALPVAGRPVAFRTVLSAVRAGARRIGLPAALRSAALERAVADSPLARRAVIWLDDEALGDEPTLLLPATAVLPAGVLGRLLAAGPGAVLAESRDDGAPAMVAGPALVAATAPALAAGTPLADALQREVKNGGAPVVAAGDWYVRVSGRRSAAEAEQNLYGGLASPIDTAIDRAVHRRLSRPLSRRAVAWGLTPNQITLASLAVGLAAVACFWPASPASALLGLALYVVAVVLDHVDGEVARLTLAESATGEWLDVTADTLVHALLVAAMGVTAQAAAGAGAGLGVLAALGVVASATVAKAWPGRAPRDGVQRVLDGLGARDGFYGMLIGFIAVLAVRPALLPGVMLVVATGANLYWLARLGWRLAPPGVNTARNPK